MSVEIARAVLERVGTAQGALELLAEGMSSSAWVGTVDGRQLVVRVPKGDGLRPTPRYDDEARLLGRLARDGAAVAPCRVVEVDGVRCSVADRVRGTPVKPHEWTDAFVDEVATTLGVVHSLPPDAAPPVSAAERFHLARLWPLDGSRLADHPVAARWPERVDRLTALEPDIRRACDEPTTVVHTDLHWEHLLRSPTGRLAALLDFGDAFAGPAAWDFACLRYYHGDEIAARVAEHHPDGAVALAASRLVGIAFGLYKLDKTPERADIALRVERLLP
ncbi:MAG: aminoglycoside phosphotransferase family protein [Acidimicrobiia bacterium]|nr:aminoglycoside phosphotransferase family protein [Acidimicrobiia bacterium]